jgi:hypothetical protein
MPEMIPFHYVEFYDLPRTIAVTHRGKLYLLQSAFDEKLDDYADAYTVYKLPEAVDRKSKVASGHFWNPCHLNPLGILRFGTFDSTPRRDENWTRRF